MVSRIRQMAAIIMDIGQMISNMAKANNTRQDGALKRANGITAQLKVTVPLTIPLASDFKAQSKIINLMVMAFISQLMVANILDIM